MPRPISPRCFFVAFIGAWVTAIYVAGALMAGLVFSIAESRCMARGAPAADR